MLYLAEFRKNLVTDDLDDMNERDRGGYEMCFLHDCRHDREKRDHLDVVRCLLGNGEAPIHTQDHIGATALHYACASGHLDLIELLIGAPRRKYVLIDDLGRTPLFWAAENGESVVVKAMTSRTSSASLPSGKAAASEHFFGDFVRLTLPRCKDHQGRLPLHAAAAAGKFDAVELLLERTDIDPETTDEEGMTALDLADLNDHLDCRASLRTAIAARARVLGMNDGKQDETLTSPAFPMVSVLMAVVSLLVLCALNWW